MDSYDAFIVKDLFKYNDLINYYLVFKLKLDLHVADFI